MNTESDTIDQNEIRREQLKLLTGIFPSSVAASMVNGLLVAILLWGVIEHTNIILWYFALFAISIIRIIQYRQFKQSSVLSIESDLLFWERSFFYGNALSGLIWGSSFIFLFPVNEPYYQAFLIFVLAGMSAGAVANLSYHLPSSLSFLGLSLSPVAIKFLTVGSTIGYAMSGMTLLLLLILTSTARRVNGNIQQNIHLRLTATKREKSLAHSQRILSLHLDQSPIAIIDWDSDLAVTEWNPSAEKLFGYSRNEAMGRKMIDLLSTDEDHGKMLKQSHCLFENTASTSITLTNIKKDGTPIICEWNCSQIIDNDTPLGITSMVVDITERKTAQNNLVASEKRFRTLLDNNPDAIFLHDKHGNIIEVNSQGAHNLGYSRKELLKLNIGDIEQNLSTPSDGGIWEQLAPNQRATVEGVHRRKDGSTFPVEVNLTAIEHNDEKLILATVRDISLRKQIEQMKSNFVSTVSHELRTPLTSIRGSLGLIQGGVTGEIPEQARSLIEIAGNNVDRLLHLINDLLDMQKIEAGKMEFHFETFSIKKLIDHAITENIPYARQFNIQYRVTPCPDVEVEADYQRLMQVMTNLLSNATKFSEKNDTVEINTSIQGDMVRIAVVDHGVGIPKDFKEQLFEKFSQVDSSDTKQLQQGTGLGLSIAKEIIQAHKGNINFTDSEGQGATFYFDLPIKRD